MAKGFTVKAPTPKVQEQEWDYDKIKERMRGKSIVFCLPGRGCSYQFLKSFVQKYQKNTNLLLLQFLRLCIIIHLLFDKNANK